MRDRFPLVDDLHGLFMLAFGDQCLDQGKAPFPIAGFGGKRLGEFRDAHENEGSERIEWWSISKSVGLDQFKL